MLKIMGLPQPKDMTGVSLTGATLKISGEIEQPSGDYRIHLLANGAIDKIAADFETFGFEVYGQDIGGMYFYSFNPCYTHNSRTKCCYF